MPAREETLARYVIGHFIWLSSSKADGTSTTVHIVSMREATLGRQLSGGLDSGSISEGDGTSTIKPSLEAVLSMASFVIPESALVMRRWSSARGRSSLRSFACRASS
jgi:hypothetical protein